MKKIKIFLAVSLILLLLLIAAIPTIISSGLGEGIILGRVNAAIPGTVTVDDLNIGWQKGMNCNGLSYHDPVQGIDLEIQELTTSQGLLSLLAAPKNLGTVTVDGPILVVHRDPVAVAKSSKTGAVSKPMVRTDSGQVQEKSSPSVEQKKSLPAQVKEKKLEEKKPAAAEEKSPFWHKMRIKLLVNQAVVKLAEGSSPVRVLTRNGFLNADLASDNIKYEVAMETGNGEGALSSSGTITLPVRNVSLLDSLQAELQLKISDVQIREYLFLLPENTHLPQGRATLSTDIAIKTMGAGNLMVRGPITLQDTALSGGFLGEDTPTFDELEIYLDLKQGNRNNWQFNGIQFISDYWAMEMSGSFDRHATRLEGQGKFDLPGLLTQFPNLFKVHEDALLTSGELTVQLDLKKENDLFDLEAETTIEHLSGLQNGKLFSWESPLSLDFAGSVRDREPEVRKLAFKAPFLDLEGKGNFSNFSLKGTADISQMLREIGRIFQLDWEGEGRVRLAVDLQRDMRGEKQDRKEDKTSQAGAAEDKNRYMVDTNFSIADFTLTRQGKTIVPKHFFSLNGHLESPRKFPQSRDDGMAIDFRLSSWPGRLSGSVKDLFKKGEQITAAYQFRGGVMLARVTEMLHALDLIDPETSVAGTLTTEATGYLEGDRLVFRKLDNRIRDFIVYNNGAIFRDKELRLATSSLLPDNDDGSESVAGGMVRPLEYADNPTDFFAEGGGWNMIDRNRHTLALRDLVFSGEMGTMLIDRFVLKDWQRLATLKAFRAKGEIDLARLTPLLQQSEVLATGQTLAGDCSLAVDLAGAGEGIKSGKKQGSVELTVSHLTIRKDKKTLLDDQELRLAAALQGDLSGGDIDFTSLALTTEPLSLQAAGRLQRTGKNPYLALDGMITPDLAVLASLLSARYPLSGLQVTGKKEDHFSLHYPLITGDTEADIARKYRAMQFSASFDAESLHYSGFDLSKLFLPISMEDGLLQVDLNSAMNKGQLSASGRVDYTVTPPQVSISKPQRLLTSVQLEKPLVDGLLQHIHPVLGRLARPRGTIDVQLKTFSCPLAGKNQAEFSTVLNLSRVTLKPISALEEILDRAGLADKPLALKENEITCTGSKGRIECSPLRMTVAGSEMILSGSVGFNGSLDYLLEIPVTRSLVGKEGYRVLKGTTLKIPIRGKKGEAKYDRDALAGAVSDLLNQAAGQAVDKVIDEQMEKILPGLMDGLLGH